MSGNDKEDRHLLSENDDACVYQTQSSRSNTRALGKSTKVADVIFKTQVQYIFHRCQRIQSSWKNNPFVVE